MSTVNNTDDPTWVTFTALFPRDWKLHGKFPLRFRKSGKRLGWLRSLKTASEVSLGAGLREGRHHLWPALLSSPFSFGVGRVLNSGLHACLAGDLPLEPLPQPSFIFPIRVLCFCAGLAQLIG